VTGQALTERVDQGSHLIALNLIDWTNVEPGVYMKTIYKDAATGESTIMMKLDPGTRSSMHSHDKLEEVLVLEGSFSGQHNTYTKGQYCIRAVVLSTKPSRRMVAQRY
jgi:anti-sigma factor ChrR (cupin superfamily)